MDKNSSDGVPLPQRYGAILTIVLGLTMAVLDGAIANVALPTIASDLNASPAASIWIVNAYQIAIVIALLPLSFLGDMVGYRRIYKIGLVVFIFTSLACALSRSLEMLTFARVAQGLGGAALMSVNTALIRLIYPQRFLGRGMGINSFVVAVSSAAGPTIAAAILSLASWQWLFLINVPLGIVAFVLAMRFLPPNSARSKIIRFDLPSAIMNALTFGLLITALSGFAQGQSTRLVLAEDGSAPALLDRESVVSGSLPEDTAQALRTPGFSMAAGYISLPLPIGQRALLFGAGHISQALCPLLTTIGFRPVVFDDRPELANTRLFPTAEQVICGDFTRISDYLTITDEDFVVIMTSGHVRDFQVEEQTLRGPFAYVGVIGSRRKTASVNQRLLEAGIHQSSIDLVHTPIGTPILAVTPEEIAVSIAGEMIQVRAQRRGPTSHGCPMHS